MLPPVDAVASALDAPREAALAAARTVLDERRGEAVSGSREEELALLVARASALLAARSRASLRRVLNATGVVLHTNLGRAPLATSAAQAVARVAEGYCNVELDLDSGARGSRHAHVESLLCSLTGAEAALAVNNGAGAVLLAAAALAGPGAEIVVSRGQLVEIGGGFRVPDVVAQAGSTLVEVGTTNRTRVEDYAAAVGSRTGAILRVHPSNFRSLGFVETVEIEALCSLGVPVIDDVGSGALVPVGDEPVVGRSVAAGAALVCFSGDKLLGGPQAGVIVGRAEAVAKARRHALARALRLDKLCLAGLEATLRLLLAGGVTPLRRMLDASEPELAARAAVLAEAIGEAAEVAESFGRVGGGTLPLTELAGPVVAVSCKDVEGVAARLRAGDPAVVGRIEDGRLLLDPRTLTDEEAEVAGALVRAVL